MGFDWVGSTENGLWEMKIVWVIRSTIQHLTVHVDPRVTSNRYRNIYMGPEMVGP